MRHLVEVDNELANHKQYDSLRRSRGDNSSMTRGCKMSFQEIPFVKQGGTVPEKVTCNGITWLEGGR